MAVAAALCDSLTRTSEPAAATKEERERGTYVLSTAGGELDEGEKTRAEQEKDVPKLPYVQCMQRCYALGHLIIRAMILQRHY